MKRLLLAGALLAMGAANANAEFISIGGASASGTTTGGETTSVSAEFYYDSAGGQLKIVLSNDSAAASGHFGNLLSGVLFDTNLTGLSYLNAMADGLVNVPTSSTQMIVPTDVDVTNHWDDAANFALNNVSYDYGVGAAGFGVFNGNLVNGPDYLITPLLGVIPNQNFVNLSPYSLNFVTFLFSAPTGVQDPSVSNIAMTLGTRPEFTSDGGGGFDGSTGAPEPATLALFGVVLAAGAMQLRRLTRK